MISFDKQKILAALHTATSAVVTVDGVTSLQFDAIKLFVRDGVAHVVFYYKGRELCTLSSGDDYVLVHGRLPFDLMTR